MHLDRRVRKMRAGTYEPDLVDLLHRFLREGDTFVDIGANIGYISARALGVVGTTGFVHAFEPVPRYFERLERLRRDNPRFRLVVNQMALGDATGSAEIAVTNLANIGWNTMVPDWMSEATVAERIVVPVTTLDAYTSAHGIERIRLVKIDVEGFEFPVLRGFHGFLESTGEPPAIVVEIAPGAYPRLATSLVEFDEFMTGLGFAAFDDRLQGPVDIPALAATTNVVFIHQSTEISGE